LVLSILLVIASIHVLRIGSYLEGVLFQYYYSFFSDIELPFGGYFLISLDDNRAPLFQKWYVKCLVIFGVAAFAEGLQAIGIPVLGVTFDPLDLVMYAVGVLAAALVEVQVFRRILPFW